MFRPFWLNLLLVVSVYVLGTNVTRAAEDDPKPGDPKAETPASEPEQDRAQLIKDFQEKMSGCQLVGYFTVVDKDGKTSKNPPREEKYTISRVSPLKDDTWLLETRIQYGKYDVPVPLSLKILWAGDTPIITLTDVAIPGLGTFTARVMIYGDRYAGTWQHGKVGGHMYGMIEKLPKKDEKPANKPSE